MSVVGLGTAVGGGRIQQEGQGWLWVVCVSWPDPCEVETVESWCDDVSLGYDVRVWEGHFPKMRMRLRFWSSEDLWLDPVYDRGDGRPDFDTAHLQSPLPLCLSLSTRVADSGWCDRDCQVAHLEVISKVLEINVWEIDGMIKHLIWKGWILCLNNS